MHVRFADCDLDTDSRQLSRGTEEIHLSPKAFELLKVLVENRPRAVPKQELLDRIWPGVFVSDASLARAVSEIRDGIGDHSRSDGFLQTVHGFGYRFASAGVVVAGARRRRRAKDRRAGWWAVIASSGWAMASTSSGASRVCRFASTRRRCRRHHARVTIAGREATVEDLGSKNGTYVRGVRIEERTRLVAGDDIQIGPIRLVFRVTEGGGTATEVWTQESS